MPDELMNQAEQVCFVLDLCNSIAQEVRRAIYDHKIPEEWDGHELRRYLADRFEESTAMSDCMKGHSKRLRAYRNHVAVTPGL